MPCLLVRPPICQLSRRLSTGALRSRSKVAANTDEALEGLGPNLTILVGGFGLSGVPDTLINAILEKPKINNITGVSNNAGLDKRGLSKLLSSGQVIKMISSFIGANRTFEKLYLTGKIDVELIPQGTLAEKIRAGGSGVPAFYTATGVSTWLEEGKLPVRYDATGENVLKFNKPRESREFDGRKYLLEDAIVADVALVKAFKADTLGNCWFRGAARNFNEVMGKNAKITIVEAEHIVEPGEIEPEDVHLPGLYVDRIIQSTISKDIEIFKNCNEGEVVRRKELTKDDPEYKREKIAKRAAKEFKDGISANLGIGIPTLVPSFIPKELNVLFQSENGILGIGPYPKKGEEDPDMINAGKETITLAKGASLFGSEESFAMIRSAKIKLALLGGLQVSSKGDLANWGLPGRVKGMGGAMDLVSNSKETRVVVLMELVDKKGRSKLLKECIFPLTGSRCVSRVITDAAVFDIINEKLVLVEIDPETTVEEVREQTDAEFIVSPDLKFIEI